MDFLFTLLAGTPFPAPPTLAGWFVWFFALGALSYALYHWRVYQPAWKGREWGIFLALALLVPLANLFIGLRVTAFAARPLPDLPADAPGSALMIFSALPWMLGGGLLGPIGAAALGAFAGLLRGAWDLYSLFAILEFAFLSAWFSANMRQRYRTAAYHWLRQPLVSALLLIPLHILFYFISALFTQWGTDVSAAARLDLAISNTAAAALAFGGEMLAAGIIAQIVMGLFPAMWGGREPLRPSPGERSLESRFVFVIGMFILLLLLTLLIGDWVVAGRAAREMLHERLASAGESAAQSIPFFLETGQSLAAQIAADPNLLQLQGEALSAALGGRLQAAPYFDEVFVTDLEGALLAGYPSPDFVLYPDEVMGLTFAQNQVLSQVYSIPPASPQEKARVSFLIAIVDANKQPQRVLIARATLSDSPLMMPLMQGIDTIAKTGGEGFLINEHQRVLYHSDPAQLGTQYTGASGIETLFYDDTAPDGTRRLTYYKPISGRPWAVVLSVPAQQAQQLSLNIALPLSLMILFIALAAMISLRVGLRVVTGSLQGLADEANRIAQGNLDHPLQVDGADEIGQLRSAFEQMRASLQARLNEINSLLRVSQGVASSLEMRDAVNPVLEAILATGASSARIALSPNAMPDTFVALPSRFTLGRETYAHLDQQILAAAQTREKIIIPNVSRSREFAGHGANPLPLALLAVALKHENKYYGVVWAGYDQPRAFSDADVRFITTLAGQAALAAANAHLYLNVEASRRQLQAVLNSTPDLVLVTDHRDRLLLANKAAMKTLGIDESSLSTAVVDAVKMKPLAGLLQGTIRENQSREIKLEDQRTYLATASTVLVEGRPTGRVCIMRDVTHFKELDTMKSEFVATVSHDLRSPLTLMRGYATMLEMVGELNEQQQGYVKKMISGVENMARLVNDLLDLGRIEIGVGLQVENVSPLDIIEKVTGALQLQAMQKNIALNIELAKDLPHAIEADKSLLHQAVYNLVENAIKYTPENQTVTVRAKMQQDQLLFTVTDTGIGILEEDIPHLFEKFYRGKQREARAQHGTGLGLAIVHSIATSHNGKVWVESALGKGSTFYLQIPLVQPKSA